MLILQQLGYRHPNKDRLFNNLNLSVNKQEKVALIGANGSGKSTLLKLIAGHLLPEEGQVQLSAEPYYLPQVFGQFNHLTVAAALGIEEKYNALNEILNGVVTEQHLRVLDDDWDIEERCIRALSYWQIEEIDLNRKMDTLSGGQKTKVFLAGMLIHQRECILLDEPSNHLDASGRALLYDYVRQSRATFLVVSHDRTLLNLMRTTALLDKKGITRYGGNYEFYRQQREIEMAALDEDVRNKEKDLRKAREKERETLERQQKLDARGRKKQDKAGLPTIMRNTLRNSAEKSTAKTKDTHAEKIDNLAQELQDLRAGLPEKDRMKLGFDHMRLHRGKVLFRATGINFRYGKQKLWPDPLSCHILSGERIALKGNNGSGKTTLIHIITGSLQVQEGAVHRAEFSALYIDQEYTLIEPYHSVLEQAVAFNESALQDHEIKNRLHRFLFTTGDWHKPCSALSGGEKMRLMLCCLTLKNQAPDMIIMDEPTNNLDIQNIELLTEAINDYKGTLIVVSHDAYFLQQLHIEREIQL